MRWTKVAAAGVISASIWALTAQVAVQTAAPAPPHLRAVIFLDPAHGGADGGAKVADTVLEKAVTLELANRIRPLLTARGFDVRMTREGDPTPTPTTDQRAGLQNQAHPAACLILHSAPTGTGVHIYTSALPESTAAPAPSTNPATPTASAIVPWDEAQSTYIASSLRLSSEISTAFSRSQIPVSSGRTWMPPLDNLLCPAVAIEIAPLSADGSKPPTDAGYQQRVAEAIAGAVLFWHGKIDPTMGVTR
jgi:N-acetylmuramoyl-L-alanine amidase